MGQKSLQPVRQRHRDTLEAKSELVAQYLQGDDSLASLAVGHGMNPNGLHRWVREHERYGKHSLGEVDSGSALVTRAPANWIALTPSRDTVDRPAESPAPANSVGADHPNPTRDTLEVELAACGLTMTVRWPVQEHKALADWTRTLLT